MDTHASHPDQASIISEPATGRRGFAITITTRSMWIAALIALSISVAIFLVVRAQGPIALLVLAVILGEAIRPLVVRLKRYHIPGPLAVLLVYLVVFLFVGVLLWVLLSPLLNEVSAFSRDLPQLLVRLQDDVHRLERSLRVQGSVDAALNALSQSLATLLRNSIPTLLSLPFNVLAGLFSLFIDVGIVLTMALFWLMSSAKLKPFVVGLFPAQSREHTSLVISEIGTAFGGYVRGLLIGMMIIGLITGLGLTILGVPYALLIGVVAGLTEVLPYIGPWISGTIAVLLALIAIDPAKALEVVILFILIQMLEGEVIEPMVMSRSVHVDPLLVIISVLIGLSLLGLIGAFLAVPIAACMQVLLVRVLVPAVRRTSEQTDYVEQSSPTVAAQTPVSVPEQR